MVARPRLRASGKWGCSSSSSLFLLISPRVSWLLRTSVQAYQSVLISAKSSTNGRLLAGPVAPTNFQTGPVAVDAGSRVLIYL
jgi:hypothetical protein